MTRVFAALGVLIIVGGCAARTPAPTPAGYPISKVPSQVYRSPDAGPVTSTALPDEAASFSNTELTQKAERDINESKAKNLLAVQTAATFTAGRESCDSAAMAGILTQLQDVEIRADDYAVMATNATLAEPDREAAMDVIDELMAPVLDAYLEVARAYGARGCGPRARFLLNEIVRVYQGDAYVGWRGAAAEQLARLPREEAPRLVGKRKKAG